MHIILKNRGKRTLLLTILCVFFPNILVVTIPNAHELCVVIGKRMTNFDRLPTPLRDSPTRMIYLRMDCKQCHKKFKNAKETHLFSISCGFHADGCASFPSTLVSSNNTSCHLAVIFRT